MSSVAQIEANLTYVLGERARKLAREMGCVKREREFDGASLAGTLIFGWMQQEQTTLERFAQIAQYSGVSVTDTAIDKRFTPQLATFLWHLLQEITQCVVQAEPVEHRLLRRFTAVVLEDSTQVTLPQELAEVWRGSGGAAGTSDAALKLHVRLDLLRGQLDGPVLSDGRSSDNQTPLGEHELPEKSLYIADLGYFALRRLQALHQSKRYFLQRLKGKTSLLTKKGHRVVLEGLLPQQEGEWICYGVLLGAKTRIPARLMIVKVPQEVAEQRREHLREDARRKGETVSEEQLKLAAWTIVVTNVPAAWLSVPDALVLLRQRWQMERLFFRWKDDSQIDEWRSKKPWRILCEVYAKLIADVIVHWLCVAGCWQDLHRSLQKASDAVRAEALSLLKALRGDFPLRYALESIIKVMRSGCRLTMRGKHPSSAQLLQDGIEWPLKSWVSWQETLFLASSPPHSS
jgi:hypothetical protein